MAATLSAVAPQDVKTAPENGTQEEELDSAGPESPKEVLEVTLGSQTGKTREFWESAIPEQVKREPNEEHQQCWETQLQGFVQALESPHSDGGSSQLLQPTLRDSKAFRSLFGDVADFNQQPRVERRTQLPPGSEELQQTDKIPFTQESRGSGAMKEEAVDKLPIAQDKLRQRFRSFRYWDAEGPQEVCKRLRELCWLWLKPESRSKEQIVELVILEQFLTILPKEIQSRMRTWDLETCSQAVALAEGFLLRQQQQEERKRQEVPEPFKEQQDHFPPSELAPPYTWGKPIKQEDGWDAFIQDSSRKEKNHPEIAGEMEPHRLLSGRSEQNISQSPDRGYLPESCIGNSPGREREKLIHCPQGYNHFNETTVQERILKGENEMEWNECGPFWRSRSELMEDQRIHSGEKPYNCTDCEESFGRRADLVNHQRIHAGKKPYQCSVCGNSYSGRSSLSRHRKTHSDKNPYTCTVCCKSFTDKANLMNHERTHTGEKPYACSECGKTFNQQSNLIVHQRTHTGEKPYHCSECGKGFSRRSHLHAHERAHTGEKPFQCLVCGKDFSRRPKLVTHQRIHTGEKPYKCCDCGKSFTGDSNLNRHKRTHGCQNMEITSQQLMLTGASF